MDQRIDSGGGGTLRHDLLRLTAAGGIALGAVWAAYVAAVLVTVGPTRWLTRVSWRPAHVLQSAGVWPNLASIALLLAGSARLWRGLRRGRDGAGRRLLLAYAASGLAGRLYLSGVLETTVQPADRYWLILGGLSDALTYSVFPAVVLVVLLRLAALPPTADARRGFDVMPPGAMR